MKNNNTRENNYEVNDINKNTHKLIQEGKEIAVKGIPEECQDTARKFFDCIEENLKPYNEDGKIYTSQELQEILDNEVIPKCKELYNLDKCLEQYSKKNVYDEDDEEEEEGEDDEIQL